MHGLKGFASIIGELTLILRKDKYIFTTKRQNITKVKQDNTLA